MNDRHGRRQSDAFNLISFAKQVGIVAGAAIAVATLASWIVSFAWATATRPIMDAISAEAQSRVSADNTLAAHMETISRDRVDLIELMALKPGPDRDRKLRAIRARWSKD